MRVLFPFVGDSIGGSHISALDLASRLPTLGYEPIITVSTKGTLAAHLENGRFPVTNLPRVRLVSEGRIDAQVAHMLRCTPTLRAFIRQQAIDIVHTNDMRMHLTWALAARAAGARFVWHQRSANASRRLAHYTRAANAVITISEFCRQAFPGAMGRRAIVVDNPFDTEAPPPDRTLSRARLVQELRAQDDTFIIGFVGNTTTQKRPVTFLDCAARLVAHSDSTYAFLLVGELRRPETGNLTRRIAKHHLQRAVHLLGPRFPVAPVIAGFDVLVAPAVREGFGRVLVEAMLVGTPVVAADDGGHCEIISHGETGLLVTPDDAEAMAEAVAKLTQDPARRRAMADRAMAAARSRFSSRRHAEKITAIYQQACTSALTSGNDG